MNGKPAENGGTKGTSLRDFVAVLFRRKWIILSVFAITATVTAVSVFSRPTVWESTGKILVKRGLRDSIYQPYERTLSWVEDLASEVETARSTAVVNESQKALDAKRREEGRPRYVIDPVRVEAAVQGESNVIGVSYRDLQPAVCVEVTDIVIQTYMEYRKQAYALPYPEHFFESESTRTHDQLLGLQEDRRQLLNRAGLTDGNMDLNQMLTVNTGSRLALNDLERETALLREEYQQWRAFQANPLSETSSPPSGSAKENTIADIKRELILTQLRYAELSRIYQPGVPQVAAAKAKVDELSTMLTEEVKSRVRAAEMDLRSKEAQLGAARAMSNQASARVAAFPDQDAKLSDLDRRIGALKESYNDLIKRAQEARIQQAAAPAWTVLLLSPAGRPYPKNTKDYVRIALAPIFSLIVGLGLAFFVDSMDTSVKSPREAENVLDLPVLATLREQKKR